MNEYFVDLRVFIDAPDARTASEEVSRIRSAMMVLGSNSIVRSEVTLSIEDVNKIVKL